MDLTAVTAAIVGAYISGWFFGYVFLAWRRTFEAAT